MLELTIVLILIALNGFFAMSEMALVTSRKPRLKQMAQDSGRAQRALELSEHPERFLSTVQVGITLIGILTGTFGGAAIGASIGQWLGEQVPALAVSGPLSFDRLYSDAIGLTLSVGLITYMTIVLGELLPKRLAQLAPERLASFVAVPMHVLSKIAIPAVWLLSISVRALLRLLRAEQSSESKVTEEEIRLLVSESHEQGVIDADERKMVYRVLSLGDRTAESLMTPRTRIVWLDAEAAVAENLEQMRETPFSRYPVYRGDDREVLGILETKSLFESLQQPGPPRLFERLREALFVSESTHAFKLLEIFREEQQSIALVVDEYGDVTGLVTVNDLLGAVIGRIQASESEDSEAPVVQRADGTWLLDGSLPLDDLRELIDGARLPVEEEPDFHTAAGMVINHFGRIPHVGEYLDWDGWRIEVVDLDGPRIDKLLLQALPDLDADSDETLG
ncbi:DUF21 domain-containing protein [Lysobacter maris]|uniref:DUF21 domain-containing protein n=1 Tax=Marilutibacter maris TaxID=1605891 RepID=A0A508A373_9GAMM|nr:hemolysin family protein [Lysobacter maris]KAB8165663.1 DUF21 domain-containing protein [Lysobacter maris]